MPETRSTRKRKAAEEAVVKFQDTGKTDWDKALSSVCMKNALLQMGIAPSDLRMPFDSLRKLYQDTVVQSKAPRLSENTHENQSISSSSRRRRDLPPPQSNTTVFQKNALPPETTDQYFKWTRSQLKKVLIPFGMYEDGLRDVELAKLCVVFHDEITQLIETDSNPTSTRGNIENLPINQSHHTNGDMLIDSVEEADNSSHDNPQDPPNSSTLLIRRPATQVFTSNPTNRKKLALRNTRPIEPPMTTLEPPHENSTLRQAGTLSASIGSEPKSATTSRRTRQQTKSVHLNTRKNHAWSKDPSWSPKDSDWSLTGSDDDDDIDDLACKDSEDDIEPDQSDTGDTNLNFNQSNSSLRFNQKKKNRKHLYRSHKTHRTVGPRSPDIVQRSSNHQTPAPNDDSDDDIPILWIAKGRAQALDPRPLSSHAGTQLSASHNPHQIVGPPSPEIFQRSTNHHTPAPNDDSDDDVPIPRRNKGKGKARDLDTRPPSSHAGYEWSPDDIFGEKSPLERTCFSFGEDDQMADLNHDSDNHLANDRFSEDARRETDQGSGFDGSEDHSLHEMMNGSESLEVKCIVTKLTKLTRSCADNSKSLEETNRKLDELSDFLYTHLGNQSSASGSSNSHTPASGSSGGSSGSIVSARSSRIRKHIRDLFRILLGVKGDAKFPPSAATPAERRQWRTSLSLNKLLREENRVVIDDSNRPTGLRNDAPAPVLETIQDTMVQASVRSYRPIWTESLTSRDNNLLWIIATAILIKLVQSGEFTGVTQEELEPTHVMKLVVSHVKGTWRRKYNESCEWSEQRLNARKKRKLQTARIVTIRDARSAFVLSAKELRPLARMVKYCCSEDETDYENDEGEKICNILKYDWRHPHLTTIFQSIDKARERKNSVKASPGNKPRIRVRNLENPLSSKTKAPAGLNEDCYCPDFLAGLEDNDKADLKIVKKPILKEVKKLISQGKLPTVTS